MAKKILVVDDEPEIVSILKFRLSSWGYEPLSSLNGEEALKVAEAMKPDLILLDVMMPGMSGFEVLKKLKAQDSTKGIPVIMVTVAAARAEIERGLKEGAAYYLTKPYDAPELLERVKKLLDAGL
jgi:DNA-binding response OmpR family regulator